MDLPEKSIFIFSDGTFVEKQDEFNIEIKDILDNNNNIYLINNNKNDGIDKDNHLNTISYTKDNDDFPLWLNSNNKNEEIKEKENINNSKEKDEIIINILNKKEFKYIRPPIKYSNSKSNIYLNKENQINDNYIIPNKFNTNIEGRKIPSISSCKKIEKLNNLDIIYIQNFFFITLKKAKP